MRFANLRREQGDALCLIQGNEAWPVSSLVPGFQGDLTALIASYEDIRGQLAPKGAGLRLDGQVFLAPFTRTIRNIFCVGKNYHEHAREFGLSGFDASSKSAEAPAAPILFSKPWTSIIGPGDPIPLHRGVTSQIDYEAELGVIIGKGGSGVTRDAAMSHVFGYTIINDVTARDLQKEHVQWHLGKSLDGFCPMGPIVVTADEIQGDALQVSCRINGELRQDANTRDLIFDIPTLIQTISAGIALLPGDVIASGTPAGVGIGFQPPRFLKEGDEVRIEIEGIGALVNRVGG